MKSWKQWPYWLNGGVIGGGIGMVFALIPVLFPCGYPTLICVLLEIPALPLFLFPLVPLSELNDVTFVITLAFWWFLAGAVVGNLVGYRRKKNSGVLFNKKSQQ